MSSKKQPDGSPPPPLSIQLPTSAQTVASETISTPKSKIPTGPSPYTLILDPKNKKEKPSPTKTIGPPIKKEHAHPKTRSKISNLEISHFKPFSKSFLYTYKDTKGTYEYLENGPTGLIFKSIDKNNIITFANEKAAHLHMKQIAWSGGKSKKTRRKNKTYKK